MRQNKEKSQKRYGFFVIMLVLFCFYGCGGPDGAEIDEKNPVTTQTPETEPTVTSTPPPTPLPTNTPTPTLTPVPTGTPTPTTIPTLTATPVPAKEETEALTGFSKKYTTENYGIGSGKHSCDGRDDVTKYSFRKEVTIPYYIGRDDASATNFSKNHKSDAVLYLGLPLYLPKTMKEEVYYVSVDDTSVAKVENDELIGLKQGTFTLTTYNQNGTKIEEITYVVATYNDSKENVSTQLSFPAKADSMFVWGLTKELPYWKSACKTLMDVSFYFQARNFYYSFEGEPEGNSLNGEPIDDWMYNNDIQTVFETNKGVCLQAAQLAAYLLADDFEDWGVVLVDGLQGHIFNWFYEDGLYYIMDYTSVISYNAWGRDTDVYRDFSSEVKVCKSIEEIRDYVISGKVDISMNYFVYMYSLRGHDELPCNINTAKYSSRKAMNGEYEEIIVGYQDIVVEDMHVLYLKDGINVKIRAFAPAEMTSRLVHGRYYVDEEYRYYYDYR